ncbi:dihydrofolate reductase, partial [Streptomyces sp. SID10244]|nr:dihydrofolate reductase [Streptomyces sp. SID10244]
MNTSPRFRYYTATTLDGFLADENDSLDWLLTQPIDDDGAMNYGTFISEVGCVVMGATTYRWLLDHEVVGG